jgi:hypothetical protein
VIQPRDKLLTKQFESLSKSRSPEVPWPSRELSQSCAAEVPAQQTILIHIGGGQLRVIGVAVCQQGDTVLAIYSGSSKVEVCMSLPEIRSSDIQAAIAEIERDGVPKARRSTRFCLNVKGRHYPPKYFLALAVRHATEKL